MDQPALPLAIRPEPPRRGRPPGAKNRRSLDLARYVEAQYGGMTPGQQSAALCLVTPKEMKMAKAAAKELGIVDHDLSPLVLAMTVKAKRLSIALGCTTMDAWLLLAKERGELMAYVHQKQPQAADRSGAAPATVFVIPEGQETALIATTAYDPDDIEIIGNLA